MIVLDTHIWLWLLHDPTQLSVSAQLAIDTEEPQNGLLVSAISVWEIAVKSSIGKLILPLPIDQWYTLASRHSGVVIEPLSPLDAIASTSLPDNFHKDPADRILVAIARRYSAFRCYEVQLSKV
ncbi:type II toxin-antitoxin system VapC family toxin [Roseofilum sp. BLCC_M91]|uniref:Type II toxin-antitoxin system VapC family toxin n=1 Tax=Roseofilum halophilum BLCC-M91 TaxID=3022259 RepID=A0ABT7BG99_9CYAN|nr:type II toxin-antitoxin system VapC family toxin [Roseofilum halophilum]MDJ1177802.1 type II toxin-antitoxin system VapC family toxin [Roseofilum halophilum BLCC-M91]